MIWAWGSLEADFLRYYGMDLGREAFGGRLSVRRFKVLASNLPPESAFGAFLRNRGNRSLADMDSGQGMLTREMKKMNFN